MNKKNDRKDPADRREYKKERARHLMAWEAPSMTFKARCYLAAELKRISFNAWANAFLFPAVDKLLDEQGVPDNPKQLFRTMAAYRPQEVMWQELTDGEMPPEPVTPRRRNARRTK